MMGTFTNLTTLPLCSVPVNLTTLTLSPVTKTWDFKVVTLECHIALLGLNGLTSICLFFVFFNLYFKSEINIRKQTYSDSELDYK